MELCISECWTGAMYECIVRANTQCSLVQAAFMAVITHESIDNYDSNVAFMIGRHSSRFASLHIDHITDLHNT